MANGHERGHSQDGPPLSAPNCSQWLSDQGLKHYVLKLAHTATDLGLIVYWNL